MLKVNNINRPVAQVMPIIVSIEGVTDETDADLAAAGMAAAHEDPKRLYGWKVYRYSDTPDMVQVTLNRD